MNSSFTDPAVAMNKILVIDDEPLVRESIAVYMEDSGYSVIEAENGQKGIELFCEFSPDVVLCDLRMPQMDGLQVLTKIIELSPNTPIIMVSGAGQISDVVKALRLGALDYIVKPVTDMAVLENAVVNALKRHELEIQNQHFKYELEQANIELEKNLEILHQDQEAGRRAQLQLLPEPEASIGGFQFQHAMIPSSELRGDIIDYFQISERYLGFYIADVSGHGAAAAFVTMTLKSLINQPLREYRLGENSEILDPAAFMRYLNQEMIKANIGKHITIFYAVIDLSSQQLTYCAAGQYPVPVIFNDHKFERLIEGSFPIGLFEWAEFDNQQIVCAEDFKIIMVSDGWLEMLSPEADVEKEKLLFELIKKQEVSLDFLISAAQKTNRKITDDVTVFIVSRES